MVAGLCLPDYGYRIMGYRIMVIRLQGCPVRVIRLGSSYECYPIRVIPLVLLDKGHQIRVIGLVLSGLCRSDWGYKIMVTGSG